MLSLLRLNRDVSDTAKVVEMNTREPSIAPANNHIGGVNIIRLVRDHGLGQLQEIDEELAKLDIRMKELDSQRLVVVKIIESAS